MICTFVQVGSAFHISGFALLNRRRRIAQCSPTRTVPKRYINGGLNKDCWSEYHARREVHAFQTARRRITVDTYAQRLGVAIQKKPNAIRPQQRMASSQFCILPNYLSQGKSWRTYLCIHTCESLDRRSRSSGRSFRDIRRNQSKLPTFQLVFQGENPKSNTVLTGSDSRVQRTRTADRN